LHRGICLPSIWIDVPVGFTFGRNPMVAIFALGFRNDTGVVAAARQSECDVCIHQEMALEHRTPWRNMIRFRGHDEHRNTDIGESHRTPSKMIAAFRQIVL
jgi:hypothetical protein